MNPLNNDCELHDISCTKSKNWTNGNSAHIILEKTSPLVSTENI